MYYGLIHPPAKQRKTTNDEITTTYLLLEQT